MAKRKNVQSYAENIFDRLERVNPRVTSKNAYVAQEMVFDAWECDDQEALRLYESALNLDDTNVDAWLGYLTFLTLNQDDRIRYLKRVIEIAAEVLGEEMLKDSVGHFWGIIETRPYMRARGQLTQELIKANYLEEAIVEHEVLLKLNPSDNMGLRYELVNLYLMLNQQNKAAKLFRKYKERKFSATFAWAYVLHRFVSDDLEDAQKALKDALKQNPYTLLYFSGLKKLPQDIPNSYRIGSDEEAIIAYDTLKKAWKTYPEVLEWLKNTCAHVL